MNSIKKTFLCAAVLTSTLLSGCGGTISDISVGGESESSYSDLSSSTDSIPEIPEENVLNWGIPSIAAVSDETVNALNRTLYEKGYDFGVKFTELDFGDYKNALMSEKNVLDIASTGLDNEKDMSIYEIMSADIFEKLDDRLSGSELYSLIPTQLWNSVTLDGSIYTVPSAGQYYEGITLFGNGSASLEEGFTADELYNALGADGKMFFASTDGLEIMELCGFEVTHEGMLISETAKAVSPLDCTECVDMLRALNTLKTEGRLIENSGGESECVLAFDYDKTAANKPLFSVKSRVNTVYGASTGILKTSEKKDNAFKLLESLRKDAELANLLIYGAGYSEKDGRAVSASGAPIETGLLKKVVFGLNGNLLFADDGIATFGTTKELFDAYNEHTVESNVSGMIFDNYTLELKQALSKVGKLWQSSDFEKDLADLRQQLNDAGIQKLVDEMNEKIGEKYGA
ncbi:MAG: hypothetical protein HDT43_08970 [Ruminococcaceae bacterium]|nr:hypothetical protein [Oscillospiraceae bacterium]